MSVSGGDLTITVLMEAASAEPDRVAEKIARMVRGLPVAARDLATLGLVVRPAGDAAELVAIELAAERNQYELTLA